MGDHLNHVHMLTGWGAAPLVSVNYEEVVHVARRAVRLPGL